MARSHHPAVHVRLEAIASPNDRGVSVCMSHVYILCVRCVSRCRFRAVLAFPSPASALFPCCPHLRWLTKIPSIPHAHCMSCSPHPVYLVRIVPLYHTSATCTQCGCPKVHASKQRRLHPPCVGPPLPLPAHQSLAWQCRPPPPPAPFREQRRCHEQREALLLPLCAGYTPRPTPRPHGAWDRRRLPRFCRFGGRGIRRLLLPVVRVDPVSPAVRGRGRCFGETDACPAPPFGACLRCPSVDMGAPRGRRWRLGARGSHAPCPNNGRCWSSGFLLLFSREGGGGCHATCPTKDAFCAASRLWGTTVGRRPPLSALKWCRRWELLVLWWVVPRCGAGVLARRRLPNSTPTPVCAFHAFPRPLLWSHASPPPLRRSGGYGAHPPRCSES